MADMKVINAISQINRALGMIEGVSYLLSGDQASAIVDAVSMIDEALKEVFDDGKDNE